MRHASPIINVYLYKKFRELTLGGVIVQLSLHIFIHLVLIILIVIFIFVVFVIFVLIILFVFLVLFLFFLVLLMPCMLIAVPDIGAVATRLQEVLGPEHGSEVTSVTGWCSIWY